MAVEATAAGPDTLALDVATGTGELALELARSGATAVGVDFAPAMLSAARAKAARWPLVPAPVFLAGDALALPFPDGTFDCATTGFALRNVTSVPRMLEEMCRVLRPGGRAACLELTPPRGTIFPRFFDLYFGRFVPWLGAITSGQADAYAYLPASLVGFPDVEKLGDLMREAGFRQVEYRLFALGAVALHVGHK